MPLYRTVGYMCIVQVLLKAAPTSFKILPGIVGGYVEFLESIRLFLEETCLLECKRWDATAGPSFSGNRMLPTRDMTPILFPPQFPILIRLNGWPASINLEAVTLPYLAPTLSSPQI